jgi:circadian clock protein KaiC
MDVLGLSMAEYMARPEQQQTLLRPSHVELDETMQAALGALDGVQPVRVAFDSLSILRDRADEPLAYRRQVTALKNAVFACGCTALVTDELLAPPDMHLRTVAQGLIRLLQEVTT